MAADLDESCLDLSEIDVNDVIRLQAVCRGWLVRRELREAQTEFQEIVTELDGGTVSVEWSGTLLPYPHVVKASKRKRWIKAKQDEQTSTPPEGNRFVSDSKVSVCVDRFSAGGEAVSKNTDVVGRQNSSQVQADQQVQTEETERRQDLPAGKLVSRDSDKNEEASCVKHDVYPVKESSQGAKTAIDFSHTLNTGSSDNIRKHSVESDRGWGDVRKDEGINGQSKQQQADNTVHRTAETAPPTKTSIELEVSGDKSGAEKSAGSSHYHAAESWTATPEPMSETSVKIKRVDSFHGDQTSVWDSSSSIAQDQHQDTRRPQHLQASAGKDRPKNMAAEDKLRTLSTDALLKQRQNAALELLWVQQAVISRKKV
ncbi:hypothetical protein V1264_009003 [Littorina saxatilis]|uniref:Uncharacterized protein n=1 Tax=Littorina saxatilis TaxID=31220 RepID=A0AAN9AQY8_9CAEN